jgi:hypothetical protein
MYAGLPGDGVVDSRQSRSSVAKANNYFVFIGSGHFCVFVSTEEVIRRVAKDDRPAGFRDVRLVASTSDWPESNSSRINV